MALCSSVRVLFGIQREEEINVNEIIKKLIKEFEERKRKKTGGCQALDILRIIL